jgi:delta14-sterol reductase
LYSPGAFVISFGLPVLVYVFTFLCNDISGCPAPILLSPSNFSFDQLKKEVGWTGVEGLLNTNAVLGTLGYYLLSLTLHTFLPSTNVKGTELRSGGKLDYRFNGTPLVQLFINPN